MGNVERVSRGVVAVTLAILIVLGPAYRHVFNGRAAYLPRWSMFSGMATGFIAARFEVETKSGEIRDLPWNEVWPRSENAKGPRLVQRLTRESELERLIRRVCRSRKSGEVLHVHAKMATRRGWTKVLDGSEDACRPINRKNPRSRR